MLAPIVMAYLAKAKNTRGLDPDGLASMLGQERSRLEQRAPTGMDALGKMLDADGDGSILDDLAQQGGGLLGSLFGNALRDSLAQSTGNNRRQAMGLFDFVRDAGEKIFGKDDETRAAAEAAGRQADRGAGRRRGQDRPDLGRAAREGADPTAREARLRRQRPQRRRRRRARHRHREGADAGGAREGRPRARQHRGHRAGRRSPRGRAQGARSAVLHRQVGRHAVEDRQAVLRQRQQVPDHLRGQSPDAAESRQDLSWSGAPHTCWPGKVQRSCTREVATCVLGA